MDKFRSVSSSKRQWPFYPRKYPFAFWLAVVSSGLQIILTAINRLLPLNLRGRFFFIDMTLTGLGKLSLNVFIMTLLVLLVVFCIAVIRLLANRKKTDGLTVWFPLAVQVLTIAILFLIPMRIDFQHNRQAYLKAAAAIEAGVLQSDKGNSVALPAGYKKLSLTGQVWVFKKGDSLMLYFPIERSVGDYQRWCLYVSNDKKPTPEELGVGAGLQTTIVKLEAHWYDVVFY